MSAASKAAGFRLARTTDAVSQHRKTAKLYFYFFAICAVLSLLAVQVAPAKPTLGYRVIGMAFAGGMIVAVGMLIFQFAFIFKTLLTQETK